MAFKLFPFMQEATQRIKNWSKLTITCLNAGYVLKGKHANTTDYCLIMCLLTSVFYGHTEDLQRGRSTPWNWLEYGHQL